MFAVIGICAIIGGIVEHTAQSAPRDYLYALPDFDLKKGEYIIGIVDFVVENYAETTEENKTLGITTDEHLYSQHYIIPCFTEDGTLRYVSAEVTYSPYMQEFNKILELSWSENEEDFQSYYFNFTGKVKNLDPELRQFALETMLDYGVVANDAEFNEIFLPVEISVLSPNAYNVVTIFVIGAITLALGAVIFLIDLKNTRQKAMEEAANDM
jgi:hypothetical protein